MTVNDFKSLFLQAIHENRELYLSESGLCLETECGYGKDDFKPCGAIYLMDHAPKNHDFFDILDRSALIFFELLRDYDIKTPIDFREWVLTHLDGFWMHDEQHGGYIDVHYSNGDYSSKELWRFENETRSCLLTLKEKTLTLFPGKELVR